MRIWDLPCSRLDRQGLLAEHTELHLLFKVISQNLNAWRNHPETRRFRGHLLALYNRHNEQVSEMVIRGWKHNSPLPFKPTDSDKWPESWESIEGQDILLKAKKWERQ